MGILVKHNGRILRLIKKEFIPHLQKIIQNLQFQELIAKKALPESRFLSAEEFQSLTKEMALIEPAQFSMCVEHEAIFFPSYPYEWAPKMLNFAGQFTLDLALLFLEDMIGLKDATPYNILFRGPNPVFVDILSFEIRNPLNPLWLPYAQFVRCFLLPLIANQQNKLSLSQLFMTKQEGLEPEEVYEMVNFFKRFSSPCFSLATLPTILSKLPRFNDNKNVTYQEKKVNDPEMAHFILRRLFQSLQKNLKNLASSPKKSHWVYYFSKEESYHKEEFESKGEIVSDFLRQSNSKKILDVGCNTGYFSILAAKQGATVVSIDSDPDVIDVLWDEAKKSHWDILPLVVDICRPSPSTGWNNAENLSFLDRAMGAFDTVMMLAVLHHMTVVERVPLENIADLCFKLTHQHLIIEFISPEDPMFRRLVRGRDSLYSHLTRDYFEKIFQRYFSVTSTKRIGSSLRWLYHFEKIV